MSQTTQESRWVGRVLRDKWRIDQKLARGGMGTVFAATHRNNGSRAAIKMLHPEFSRDADTRSRFLQEGYAANQVNHSGVVRILDDDMTEEGNAFLVMELLVGELVEERRIRLGGRLSLDEVYEIADQLLDVLSAAHTKGIVHRDVKPDNMFLVDERGAMRLKLLDFGFAQMKSGSRREQTATGLLLGTPGFMAPEQAGGKRRLIDAQTDIWSVGATLFLLLTGQPVHEGEGAAEILLAAANYPVRSIMTLDPHLPTKLADTIDRALTFEKAERWPDARSMQKALRAVSGRPKPQLPPVGDEDLTHPRGVHVADEDGPTIARAAPAFDGLVTTRAASGYPAPLLDALVDGPIEGTVVMQSRPVPRAPYPSAPEGFVPAPAPAPPPTPPRVSFTNEVRPFERSPSFHDHPTDLSRRLGRPSILEGTARGVEKPRRPTKVVSFILIAGVTAMGVILTGLLVLLALD